MREPAVRAGANPRDRRHGGQLRRFLCPYLRVPRAPSLVLPQGRTLAAGDALHDPSLDSDRRPDRPSDTIRSVSGLVGHLRRGCSSAGGRSPGWWLQLIGLAHAGVGVVLHREPLAEIIKARVIGTVPDRGDRATAFWFLVVAPTSWVAGRLLASAELTGDLAAQRQAGAVLTVVGVAGAAAMPVSPFWSLIAVGVSAVRRGRAGAR